MEIRPEEYEMQVFRSSGAGGQHINKTSSAVRLIHHATGIVVGETAVIEDDVSILQSVTLGGTGKTSGDRHPKIREGVMIGAGAKILGNIEVGRGAKIGAGSVVLQPVPPHTTAAGVPARIVGKPESDKPAMDMDQHFNGIHHTFEYGDGI